jgi:hypothetical protein
MLIPLAGGLAAIGAIVFSGGRFVVVGLLVFTVIAVTPGLLHRRRMRNLRATVSQLKNSEEAGRKAAQRADNDYMAGIAKAMAITFLAGTGLIIVYTVVLIVKHA